MRIGIIAPCAVPFVVGGAEKLWWGLERYINEHTEHIADIIKLPSREQDLFGLAASYRAFSGLDLSGFDLVLSTKYPAWAVQHDRHVVYLQHKLRGLYDAYPGAIEIPEKLLRIPAIASLLTLAEKVESRSAQLGDLLKQISALELEDDPEIIAAGRIPGPLARRIVHVIDACLLSPRRIARFAAISHEVAARADYFPPDVTVKVLHHPTSVPIQRSEHFDYLFTASRLDGPKRIGLLIDAMHLSRTEIPLKIAGDGPQAELLRAQAAGDPRIHFLGHVSERELINLYANSLAVLFVPFKEDYGLITLEAMLAGKAVLTASDSGGTGELVVHEHTGFIVPSEAQAIAKAIDRLATNRARTIEFGVAGFAAAQAVTWQPIVDWLTGKA